MMRRKVLTLVLLFIVTTGCSVNYEVTIDDDTIDELVQITENIERTNNNILNVGVLSYNDAINNLYKVPTPVYIDANVNPYDEMEIIDGVDYYNKNMISTENQYGMEATYNHNLTNYQKSSALHQCYKNISVLRDDNTITLSTSRNNLCFDKYQNLEEINVHIKFDEEKYKVNSHNADTYADGDYYWNINTNNYSDKSIVIEIAKKSMKTQTNNQNTMLVLIGFIVIIIIGVLVAVSIATKQNQKKNSI